MNTLQRATDLTVQGKSEETGTIAEIQAKMILARQFPRDIETVIRNIRTECCSKTLAENAQYEYLKGDTVVKGASIRLIEVIARHFGNLICGVKELERNGNKATVKAYAWDIENNFADEKIFEVELKRYTKKGAYALTDEREIYEKIANYGSRRKRACLQAVIPYYVIEEAVEECEKTLSDSIGEGKKLEETKNKMLEAFGKLDEWITADKLEGLIGKDYKDFNQRDIVRLRNLYNAIKDGFVKARAAFGEEDESDPKAVLSENERDLLAGLNEEVAEDVNTDKR